MRGVFLLAALLSVVFAFGQVQRDYIATYQPANSGGANLHSWTKIAVDSQGNAIVIGSSIEDFDAHAIEVAKYAPGSNVPVWTHRFTGTASVNVSSASAGGVAVDGNDDVYVAGMISNTGTGEDVYVRKILANGTLGWTATLDLGGADLPVAIKFDVDRVVVAASANRNPNTTDVWVRAFDPASGATIWTQTYDRGFADDAVDLQIASNIYYVLAKTATATGADCTLLRYTFGGSFLGASHYNVDAGGVGPMNPYALGVSQGRAVATGTTNFYTSFTVAFDAFAPGTFWSGSRPGAGRSVAFLENGDPIIGAASVNSFTGNMTAMLVRKYDAASGAPGFEFLDSGGGSSLSQDLTNHVLTEPGGTILYCGQYRNINNTDNIRVGRLNPNGTMAWARSETGSNGTRLAVTPAGVLYATGSAIGGAAWLAKYTLAPITRPDSYTVRESGQLVLPAPQGVLANDVYAAASTATMGSPPSHGAVILNSDGGFTYTPDYGYVGPDSFTYVATTGALTANGTVTIDVRHGVREVNIIPAAFTGGSPVPCSVAMSGVATDVAGDIVAITYLTGLGGPSTVNVPQSDSYAVFTITSTPVASATIRTIQATYDGVTVSDNATVIPYAPLSVTATSTTLYGGQSTQGRVTINGRAGPGGVVVALEDNGPYITVPASVTVPEGSTSATFTIWTNNPPAFRTGVITARIPPAHRTLIMSINPVFLSSLSVSPTSVVGGNPSTGTVRSNVGAPPGGLLVSLSDSSSFASVPANVTIPAGNTSATFTVTTLAVASSTNVTITGYGNGVGRTATLTVRP